MSDLNAHVGERFVTRNFLDIIPELRARVAELEAALVVFKNSDNWELVYAECRDEHVWAWVGPEVQPWLK
jgi:hypothetical protein